MRVFNALSFDGGVDLFEVIQQFLNQLLSAKDTDKYILVIDQRDKVLVSGHLQDSFKGIINTACLGLGFKINVFDGKVL